jgi:hypothetical protein
MGISPNFISVKDYSFTISESVSPPASVMEGEPFSTPVVKVIKTNDSTPVKGVLCMAYVYSYADQEYQLGYRYKLLGGRTKDILYSISANYKP